MIRRGAYIVIPVAILFLILVRCVKTIGPDNWDKYYVVSIIDGDTAELEGHEKVRLLGIDTPEEGQPYYDSASVFLSNLILHKYIDLRFSHRRRDHYGRLLAYLYLDSIFINGELIRNGLAHVYIFPDNKSDTAVIRTLIENQRLAMSERIGVWQLPSPRAESEYIGNVKQLRFHRPDCRSVSRLAKSGREVFISRDSAFYYGYSPCRNCQP